MALQRPALTADTTSTDGVGTYTLNDPASPGVGLRTLADAVASGHVTDGSTVYYTVRDGGQGSTLEFEAGIGTVGSSGTTLARTTIIESTNAGAAVSWPSGGARVVYIAIGASGLAILAAANAFTQRQAITGGLEIQAANVAGVDFYVAGVKRGAVDMTSSIVQLRRYATDGTTVDTRVDIASGLVNVQTGTLQQGGTAVALQGVLSAPAGTKLLLGNPSVPAGWAIVAGLADRTIMLTSTDTEPDDTGGSWTTGLTASTSVTGTAITEAQMPSHTHDIIWDNKVIAVGTGDSASHNVGISGASSGVSNATGGGSTHTHSASTTITSSSYRPAYVKAAFIEKS